ncbi:MAG: BON domain-containing protein [Candidatus Eremiobacteraeota bacterium]|nr:BON domain-containing protein [Candidatus Eremiobacteraeota bacterium]
MRPWLAVSAAAVLLGGCSKNDVDSVQNAIASAVPGLASAAPALVGDAGTTVRIEARFARIDPSSAFHVVVSVRAGAVRLSGTGRSLATEQRFVAAARGVRDVKTVTSALSVDATLPNVEQSARDFALEAAVRAKLVEEAGVNGVSVEVLARHGDVTLSGDVPSQSVATTLVTAAKSTSGALRVENKLQVK